MIYKVIEFHTSVASALCFDLSKLSVVGYWFSCIMHSVGSNWRVKSMVHVHSCCVGIGLTEIQHMLTSVIAHDDLDMCALLFVPRCRKFVRHIVFAFAVI